jgi:hypothetical protein
MPGGKGRKRKESCEGAEEDLADAPPPRYELRTPILGFHRKQLYAGMAIKRRRRDDSWQYLVHYNGWGAKYDEWVNEDLLYPDTDESRRVAESLRTSAEQQEKQRLARKDEADAMAEDLGSEYVIQIIIPHTLQTHLLKEADFVKDGKVPSTRARGGGSTGVWAQASASTSERARVRNGDSESLWDRLHMGTHIRLCGAVLCRRLFRCRASHACARCSATSSYGRLKRARTCSRWRRRSCAT